MKVFAAYAVATAIALAALPWAMKIIFVYFDYGS